MSIDAIKDELTKLNPAELHNVMSFAVRLRMQQKEARLRESDREISNKDPENWVTVAQLRDRIAALEAQEDSESL